MIAALHLLIFSNTHLVWRLSAAEGLQGWGSSLWGTQFETPWQIIHVELIPL